MLPVVANLPTAQAVTTINCSTVGGVPTATCTNTAGGQSSDWGNQRHVFYANGYWWVFYGTSGGTPGLGITYQSCPATGPTSCSTSAAWSPPAIVTVGTGATGFAGVFDAFLGGSTGTTLYYVVAPLSNVQTFIWGAINLPNTGTIVAGSYASSGLARLVLFFEPVWLG